MKQKNKIFSNKKIEMPNDNVSQSDIYSEIQKTNSSISTEYAQLSDVYTRQQINSKLRIYALSSDVYPKNQLSNKNEIETQFKKYQPKGNYVLSDDVYSKKYIDNAINPIKNELDTNVFKLDKDININNDIIFKRNVDIKTLNSDNVKADFKNIKNTNPIPLISTLTDNVTYNDSIIQFYQSLNELILDSSIDVDLVNTQISKSSSIEDFVNQLNNVSEITNLPKILNTDSLSVFVNTINKNISRLSSIQDDKNISQSLSCLANKILCLNAKSVNNRTLITNILNTFENGYTRSQTSSVFELNQAFKNAYKTIDNYALSSDVYENYATKNWIKNNFVNSNIPTTVNCNTTFDKDISINGTLNAEKILIDYNNLLCKNGDGYLSTYLYKLYQPSMFEIINRINEIKIYCDLNFIIDNDPLCENIFAHICNATNYICRYCNIETLPNEDLDFINVSYEDVQNALNKAIDKIQISDKISLHKILITQQYINMTQSAQLFNVYTNTINNLSTQIFNLEKENDNLKTKIENLNNKISELSNNIFN